MDCEKPLHILETILQSLKNENYKIDFLKFITECLNIHFSLLEVLKKYIKDTLEKLKDENNSSLISTKRMLNLSLKLFEELNDEKINSYIKKNLDEEIIKDEINLVTVNRLNLLEKLIENNIFLEDFNYSNIIENKYILISIRKLYENKNLKSVYQFIKLLNENKNLIIEIFKIFPYDKFNNKFFKILIDIIFPILYF